MRHEVPVPAHKSNYSIVSDKAEWSLHARVTATTTVHPGPLLPETTTETILILKCSVLPHARTHTPTCKHNCIFDLTALNSWWKIYCFRVLSTIEATPPKPPPPLSYTSTLPPPCPSPSPRRSKTLPPRKFKMNNLRQDAEVNMSDDMCWCFLHFTKKLQSALQCW